MFAALAVAVAGVLALVALTMDHRPRVETAEAASHRTTGEAAGAVGATVTPTAPKPKLEPVPPGPKPAEPPNPATP